MDLTRTRRRAGCPDEQNRTALAAVGRRAIGRRPSRPKNPVVVLFLALGLDTAMYNGSTKNLQNVPMFFSLGITYEPALHKLFRCTLRRAFIHLRRTQTFCRRAWT